MRRRSLSIHAWTAALAVAGALAGPALAQTTGGAGGTAETSNPAPAVAAAQVAPGTIELIPPVGPVGEEVRIIGSGLTPNAPVLVLGGTDPAQLTPLTTQPRQEPQQAVDQQVEYVDSSGAFRTLAEVPETAEYGSTFYFALKIGDQVTQPMGYLVDPRQPAPAN